MISGVFLHLQGLIRFPDLARSHLINRSWPRKSNLGRVARRERRAYPQGSVRSEQRRQTPQSALALRVVPLFGLNRVASRSQIPADMLPRRALFKPKNRTTTRPTPIYEMASKPFILPLPPKLTSTNTSSRLRPMSGRDFTNRDFNPATAGLWIS